MNPDTVPKPNQQFKIEQIDGETLLYHLGQTKTVYLNESASLIWQLCDGERSIDDIVTVLTQQYPDQAQSIASDVNEALEHFVLEGAIEINDTQAK